MNFIELGVFFLSVVLTVEAVELFEGDIILSHDQLISLQSDVTTDEPVKRWPGGVVYYELSNRFKIEEKGIILKAMEVITKKTCIKFMKRTPKQQGFIYFKKKRGGVCTSELGYTSYRQTLSLIRTKCIDVGRVIHFLYHSLGFFHMSNYPERNRHIKIVKSNIKPEAWSYFKRLSPRVASTFGTPYDLKSIMHFANTEYTVEDRLATIIPKNPHIRIGQRWRHSKGDITRLKRMYRCKERS